MSDPIYDPYRPGAGRVPPLLAGREDLLNSFDSTVHQTTGTGEGPRPLILFGLRGVGKTALLNEFVLRARDARWLTVKIEATPDRSLGKAITQALYRPLRDLRTLGDRGQEFLQRAVSVFTSFQIRFDPQGNATFGFDVEPERGVADTGELATDLVDLLAAIGTAARENDVGLLIAIDELQDAPLEDLRALNLALHELGQDPFPVPVVFIGAGLPSLPAVLADATSYAERLYDYRSIGLLDEQAAREAFSVPARAQGVDWQPDALAAVVDHAAGYPSRP
ncbi:ATP-binding protein [Cryocola sp. 340MFSha3.1]|uniref:ATP-binding protein n=1 Tax=Cryocola sp. 340MFSha3.1 TaxID=1169145 RepID=UPI0003719812|nr:ATP-binding protein [Cryocola sp. 340MFSha3.1]